MLGWKVESIYSNSSHLQKPALQNTQQKVNIYLKNFPWISTVCQNYAQELGDGLLKTLCCIEPGFDSIMVLGGPKQKANAEMQVCG